MSSPASKALLCGGTQLPTVKVGEFTLSLHLDEPTPEVKEIARKELRETPENVEKGIKELKELILGSHHRINEGCMVHIFVCIEGVKRSFKKLIKIGFVEVMKFEFDNEEEGLYAPYDNEAWMIRFLRPTKFYPESAFKLVKNYYEFKNKHSNIYDGLVPSKEKKVFSHDIITVLPKRDQAGRRILVLSLGKKWKHKEVCLDEVYKGACLLMEAAMLEPETQICGVQVIFDMDGLSLQQVWQFTPPFAKRIVDWLQDSVPLRVKGIHVVNQPYIFNMVFQLFKPFLREKLKSRIIFHGNDRKSLHQQLDPSCLPEAYGGCLDVPPFPPIEWYNMLITVEQEFEKINSYGYKKVSK